MDNPNPSTETYRPGDPLPEATVDTTAAVTSGEVTLPTVGPDDGVAADAVDGGGAVDAGPGELGSGDAENGAAESTPQGDGPVVEDAVGDQNGEPGSE